MEQTMAPRKKSKQTFNTLPNAGLKPVGNRRQRPTAFTSPSGEKYWLLPSGEKIRQRGLADGFPGGPAAERRLEQAIEKISAGFNHPRRSERVQVFTPLELDEARNTLQGLLNRRRGTMASGNSSETLDTYNDARRKWGLKTVSLEDIKERGLPVDEVAKERIVLTKPSNAASKTQKEWDRIRDSYRAARQKAMSPMPVQSQPLNSNDLQRVRSQLVQLIRGRMVHPKNEKATERPAIPKSRQTQKTIRPAATHGKEPVERQIMARFQKLSPGKQRNAMEVLNVAKKLLDFEERVRRAGKMALAKRCMRAHVDAMNLFFRLLNGP